MVVCEPAGGRDQAQTTLVDALFGATADAGSIPAASIKVRETTAVNVELAQRIALVAHGNAFLSGLIESPRDLLKENSAFQYVRSVEFRMSGRSIHRVDLWFSALARRKANRLWVRGNDLVAEGDGVREVWLPSGVLISKRFEERRDRQLGVLIETGVWNEEEHYAISSVMARTERPWRLLFKQESRKSRPRDGVSLPASRAGLVEAVTEAREFSRRQAMGFVGWFDKSLSFLRSRNPVPPYYPDMLPPVGYSIDARQVIAAAAHSWVFGPWGWGDRAFKTDAVEADFRRVDAKLRASVWGSLMAAANSFDGSQEGRKAV